MHKASAANTVSLAAAPRPRFVCDYFLACAAAHRNLCHAPRRSSWPIKSASRSSGSGSAPSSSPSIRPTRTPRCTPSAGGTRPSSTRCGDQFGVEERYTDYDELLEDPNVDAVHINSPDPRPRPAEPSPRSRPASTSPAPCRWALRIDECKQIVEAAAKERQGLHDDGDGRLQPRVSLRQGPVRSRRAGPDPVPARLAISRTWTAGRTTGRACRRCGTPRTASARAWRS